MNENANIKEKDRNKHKLVISDWDPNAIVKIAYDIVKT